MYLIYIMFLLLPGTVSGTAKINLPSAQTTSLADRPLLNASRQTIIASQKDEQRLFGQMLPQFSGTFSSTATKVLSVNESAHTISLCGSQVIFDYPSKLQREIANLATTRTTYQYQASSQEVRYAVATSFLQAWLLQEKTSLIQALNEYTDLLEQNNNELFKVQSISYITWAATNAMIAQNKATIATYPLAYKSALTTLAQNMGTNHALTNSIEHLSYDLNAQIPYRKTLDYYVELAYQNRPELKDKNAATKQQELIASSYRCNYLPTINVQGSASQTFAGAAIERGSTASIGVSLRWNFFDGLQALRSSESAEAHKLRITFEKQELKNSIATSITILYNTLCSNEILVAVAKKRTEAQEELLTQTTAAYRLGTIDSKALTKDRYDYESAAHDLRTQQITLHTNWQTLAWYCGYPTSGVLNES